MADKKKPQVPDDVLWLDQKWLTVDTLSAANGNERPQPRPIDRRPSAHAKETAPDPAVIAFCAELDHSDTDNAKRLQLHFGQDLVVVTEEKSKESLFGVWTGTHWDVATGRQKALAIAQKIGDLISMESEYVSQSEHEQIAIEKGKAALEKDEAERTAAEKKLAKAAQDALDEHGKRIKRRLDHGTSSKNIARLNAMLACVSPHIMRHPNDFNADKWTLAVRNATLTFTKVMTRKRNARFVSLEETPDAPEFIDVCQSSSLDVFEGHRREDLITSIVPVDYNAKATCPRWLAFMNSKLPDADVRRLVQVSSALCMLGVTVQYLFFHYGNGANGKSVYMETLCRILGEVAVTLPATSIIGEGGNSGGASPDIVRLYGKRMLRVKELPEGEPLRENLVKELTGGESITARNLFSGYMDFESQFIAMMSGNGYPKITGTDDGIWRRMAVIHWPRQIAEEDRRDFHEVIASFVPEYPGILNWLIEGVHIFIREGLVIPATVKRATQEYRDEMDRTAAFVTRCIVRDANAPPVEGKLLYQAYCDFTIDQGGKPMNLTAFGREMGKKFEKDRTTGIVLYRGIRLINLPERQSEPPQGRFDAPPHDGFEERW